MTRRFIAGPLWFIAISSLVTFAETLGGQPRQFGALFGILAAAFVILDPLNRVWSTRPGPFVGAGRQVSAEH
jgi:hypothetical protein